MIIQWLLLPALALGTQHEAQRIDAMDIGIRELQSGYPTITGIPTFLNGFAYSDTTRETATTDNSTKTYSGLNTFAGGIVISSSARLAAGAYLEMGGVGGGAINSSGLAYWATSIDGAQQSSGCVVAVTMSGGGDTANLQFTSTTTIISFINQLPGVLLETCATAATCRVGLWGVYRVTGDNDLSASYVRMSTTRCRVQSGDDTTAAQTLGKAIGGCASAGAACWIRLQGH